MIPHSLVCRGSTHLFFKSAFLSLRLVYCDSDGCKQSGTQKTDFPSKGEGSIPVAEGDSVIAFCYGDADHCVADQHSFGLFAVDKYMPVAVLRDRGIEQTITVAIDSSFHSSSGEFGDIPC